MTQAPASVKVQQNTKKWNKKIYGALWLCMRRSPQDFERKLKEALAQGYPIDFKNDGGDSLLMRALGLSKAVDARIPEILLDYGADPNAANNDGWRPLNLAAICARPSGLIRRLVQAGAFVDAKTNGGWTAFNMAARNCICPMGSRRKLLGMQAALTLLDCGADPFLCRDWLRADVMDAEEEYASRRELLELCEAYRTKRSPIRLQEVTEDIDLFEREYCLRTR